MSNTVLIVEDSLTVRMDLAAALEAAGFRVRPCSTLGEARAALDSDGVELALLDVLLPDGDGVEFLREIRAHPERRRLPVILLSSAAEVQDRIRGLTTGADEYVGKPYDLAYLLARMRELLRSSGAATPATTADILVIDDSPTYREELRRALEAAGYRVLAAANGDEGLQRAAEARPAAVVVDFVLPGMDGVSVIRRIRLDAALRSTPCVLLTASEDRGAELRALEAGADAFVRKEEDAAVIVARLSAVLRSAGVPSPDLGAASLAGPKRILAVDDSPTYLQAVAAALRGEGYEVATAHSGDEALEFLAVQPVDCVLLDVIMPGLGGRETCARIKASGAMSDIPVILLTALEDRAAMLEGLGAGADDYIAKSADFEVLRARVRAQLRRRQFESENRSIRERLLRTEMEAAEARAARELAEARAALLQELERKNRELEAFSYSVSHDLRAPLRSIDGFSQALLEDCGDRLQGREQDYLRRIRKAAQRMAELIDDLLELSRVGRAEMRKELVDLASLARAVAAEIQKREPRPDASIAVSETGGVFADGRLLRVVLENLLGNAWKFTSRTPNARIELGVRKLNGEPVYFVRDNGVGFSAQYASKLFAPFQRLHRQDEFPGTGIGLATVHRIIERHGGRIWPESAPGEGAAFFWTLPSPEDP
jgi:DNA-binding response OmpR family regulator